MPTLNILLIIILITFCSPIFANQYKDIFVLNHGWHSGIVLKTKDINNSILRLDSNLDNYQYLEFGWGDEAFYKNSDPSIWTTLKAGLIPTSSVLHVRALSIYDLNIFSKEDIVKVTLSKTAYTKLLTFIENSFAKKDSKSIILSKGLYPKSFFYLSSKKYHIFYTCNVWTAEALRSADMDISASFVLTTDSLFSQIHEIQNKP
jgi:uncharacterized protein (TIGR02117 family)